MFQVLDGSDTLLTVSGFSYDFERQFVTIILDEDMGSDPYSVTVSGKYTAPIQEELDFFGGMFRDSYM